jgi:hypothetical protein
VRGLFVGVVGAVAIAAATFGLSLDALRAGPIEVPLLPATVPVDASGTYHARGEAASPLGSGVCPLPPCGPSTTIDLRFQGLPAATYEAWLAGPVARHSVGPLVPDGVDFVLRWSEASDHTDKGAIALTLAGRDIARLPVRASPEPLQVATTITASWEAMPAQARVNEIGGVTLSTVAVARLPGPAPVGWEYWAHFEGKAGAVDLGALSGTTLDGRAERLRLEDQDRLVIRVAPVGSPAGDGFPVLEGRIWPG